MEISQAVTIYKQYWLHGFNLLQSQYSYLVTIHPPAPNMLKQVYKVLADTVRLSGCTRGKQKLEMQNGEWKVK
jgi:hypothetical protein